MSTHQLKTLVIAVLATFLVVLQRAETGTLPPYLYSNQLVRFCGPNLASALNFLCDKKFNWVSSSENNGKVVEVDETQLSLLTRNATKEEEEKLKLNPGMELKPFKVVHDCCDGQCSYKKLAGYCDFQTSPTSDNS